MSSNKPYTIAQNTKTGVLIKFARSVDQQRSDEYDSGLNKLVDKYDLLVCDISESEEFVSEWLRKLCELTQRALAAGKKVIVVGMKPVVAKTTDAIRVRKCLVLVKTLEEVWPK